MNINPTALGIVSWIFMLFVGLVLLLIGGTSLFRESWKNADREEDEKTKERLDFLKRYSIQLESMKNQHTIEDEEYESEMEYVNRSLDELESKKPSDQHRGTAW